MIRREKTSKDFTRFSKADHATALRRAESDVEAAKEARRVGARYDDTLARAYLNLRTKLDDGGGR